MRRFSEMSISSIYIRIYSQRIFSEMSRSWIYIWEDSQRWEYPRFIFENTLRDENTLEDEKILERRRSSIYIMNILSKMRKFSEMRIFPIYIRIYSLRWEDSPKWEWSSEKSKHSIYIWEYSQRWEDSREEDILGLYLSILSKMRILSEVRRFSEKSRFSIYIWEYFQRREDSIDEKILREE